jgi:hypothetical protein
VDGTEGRAEVVLLSSTRIVTGGTAVVPVAPAAAVSAIATSAASL